MKNGTTSTSAALAALLPRQYRVISRAQAIACGLKPDMLQKRIGPAGPWQRLCPGVYLTLTGTPTVDQRDMAAILYSGSGSVITGAAALRRHGIRVPRGPNVDVLVPATRRRQSAGFVVVHLTTRVPRMVAADAQIQFALPARAVADAARSLSSLPDVRAMVAGALQRRRCTLSQLMDEVASGPMQRSGQLRAVLAEVSDGVRSAPEADFRGLIARAGLPTPLFNARLYEGDVLVAVPDAWWPDFGVAAEVDSREWHLAPDQWEHTMRRHARMAAAGILVLHFSPRQIREDPAEVVGSLRSALLTRRGQSLPGITTLPVLQ